MCDVSGSQMLPQHECFSEDDACWVCLDGHSPSNPLIKPCNCPSRLVHHACLARWQLQQAGKAEESSCRFCNGKLPDWRSTSAALPKATPIMTIVHNGQSYQVSVEPGPRGKQRFMQRIREIFGLEEGDEVQLTFGCKVPGTAGEEVTLEGFDAFDAAVHCASVSAGQRMQQRKQAAAASVPGSSGGAASPNTGSSPRSVTDTFRKLFGRATQQ